MTIWLSRSSIQNIWVSTKISFEMFILAERGTTWSFIQLILRLKIWGPAAKGKVVEMSWIVEVPTHWGPVMSIFANFISKKSSCRYYLNCLSQEEKSWLIALCIVRCCCQFLPISILKGQLQIKRKFCLGHRTSVWLSSCANTRHVVSLNALQAQTIAIIMVVILSSSFHLSSCHIAKTSRELRMMSIVTINCQVTKIVMNTDSQLSEQ